MVRGRDGEGPGWATGDFIYFSTVSNQIIRTLGGCIKKLHAMTPCFQAERFSLLAGLNPGPLNGTNLQIYIATKTTGGRDMEGSVLEMLIYASYGVFT